MWSEFKTHEGKVYYYNKITRVSVWEKPKDFDLVMPLPPEIGGPSLGTRAENFPSSNQQQIPHPHPTQSPASRPPLMSTPLVLPPGRLPFNPGFAPGHPAINPGLMPPQMMPHYAPPVHHMNPLSGDGQQENSIDTKESDPEVIDITKDTVPPVSHRMYSVHVPYISILHLLILTCFMVCSCVYIYMYMCRSTCTCMDIYVFTHIQGEGVADSSAVPTATEGGSTEADESMNADTQTTPVEQVPVKEEPKGPRPTASIPVPGTHTYISYFYCFISCSVLYFVQVLHGQLYGQVMVDSFSLM